MILAVSILLYAAGILVLAGVVMLARDLSSKTQRKNQVLLLGILLYLVALAMARYVQGSIEPVGDYQSVFALGGLITAWVGWFALFCIAGTSVLRRVLSSESGPVGKLRRTIYWLSALALLAASWIGLWSGWYPWGVYLGAMERSVSMVIHLALLLFLIAGWRMVVSIFTTGKVPDEFKV